MDYSQIALEGLIARLREKGQAIAKADEIFQPIWDYLTDTQRRMLGKSFYDNVNASKVQGVTLNRKNAAGRPYYNI